jgi:hypothetical protein
VAGVEETLFDFGYRLVEDAWDADGRRTYVHDDDASRTHLAGLRQSPERLGWSSDQSKLRSFRNPAGEEIEIEPGGADTDGIFCIT